MKHTRDLDFQLTFVIIGGSTAGLSTAAGLLKKSIEEKVSIKVYILTDRALASEDSFIRPQYTTIFAPTHAILARDQDKISNTKHSKFLSEINPDTYKYDNRRTGAIKSSERALWRQIQLYSKSSNNFTALDRATILHINTETHEIIYYREQKDKAPCYQKIHYHYLVIADGSRRDNLKNFFLNQPKPLVNLIKLDIGYQWPYHASIALEQTTPMQKLSGKFISAVEQTLHDSSTLPKFKAQGWRRSTPPITFCLSHRSHKKVVVSSEIPEIIYFEPDKTRKIMLLQQWAKLVVTLQMQVNSDELKIKLTSKHPQKASLRHTTFILFPNLQKVDRFFIKTAKGGVAFVGDCAMDSEYSTAMGLNCAIQMGDYFASCFKGDQFDDIAFSKRANEFALSIEDTCRQEQSNPQRKFLSRL